jgi:signal transduction histidine kinase
VHRFSQDLRPSILDDLGLVAALEWYAEERLEAAGVKVRIETLSQERKLPPEVESTLFRVIQEAISNIARHAQAQNVSISLDFRDHRVTARVEDEGLGFEVAEVFGSQNPQRSLGLIGMRERVGLLGGELRVQSQPGAGTEIEVDIPLSGGPKRPWLRYGS